MLDLRTLSAAELESLLKVHVANRPAPTWALGTKPPIQDFAAWQKKLGPWNDRKDQIQYHLDLKTMVVSKPFVKAEDIAPAVAAELDAHLPPPKPPPSKPERKPPKPLSTRKSRRSHELRLAKLEWLESKAFETYKAGDRKAYLRIGNLRASIRALRKALALAAPELKPLPLLHPGPQSTTPSRPLGASA